MSEILTKKDKLSRLRQTLFTGRTDKLSLLRSLLPLVRSAEADILVIYGIGGIGKSALLGEYHRICTKLNVPVVLIDGQAQRNIFSILIEIKSQLARTSRIDFPQFEECLKRYYALQEKLAKHHDIPQKISGILFQSAKAVPIAGIVAEAIGEENVQHVIDAVYSAVGRKNGEFFFQPEEELTRCMVTDVNKFAAEQRIVFMFDTYEVIDALDHWVRDRFFANLSNYALIVIAGRHRLDGKAWSEFFPLMIQTELDALSDTEAREYLLKRGVSDDIEAHAMNRFADGHPLTLALLSELPEHTLLDDLSQIPDRRKIIKDLIERIVGQVAVNLRVALEICGVLRYVTEENLSFMLEPDIDDISGLFAKLREIDFIRMRNGGLALHEIVRGALDEDLCWRAPARYRMLHGKASKYYEKQLTITNDDNREYCILEWLYHSICANEEEGMRLFQKRSEELVSYHLISRLRTLLDEANGYPLKQENSKLWRKYYTARLKHLEGQRASAEKVYQTITENEHSDPKLRAYALCDWGEILTRYERLVQPDGIEKATAILNQSLNLVPLDFHFVRSFVALARAQGYQFRLDEVADLLKKAKEFFEQREDKYGLAYT